MHAYAKHIARGWNYKYLATMGHLHDDIIIFTTTSQ